MEVLSEGISATNLFEADIIPLGLAEEVTAAAEFLAELAGEGVAITVSIPAGQITLTAFAPEILIFCLVSIPTAGITLEKYNPSYIFTPAAEKVYTLQNIYLCILTGAADGLDDITIPISSFQSILRRGDVYFVIKNHYFGSVLRLHWHFRFPLKTQLSCVIPNSIDYIEAIAARTNGDIVIKKGFKYSDGTITAEEICRVAYESLQIDRSTKNDNATISGYRETILRAGPVRNLTGISFYGVQTDGKRKLRAALDLFLRVGAVATFDGESITVGQISYIVDSVLQTMEVIEAEDDAAIVYPTTDPTQAQYDHQQEEVDDDGWQPYPQYPPSVVV